MMNIPVYHFSLLIDKFKYIYSSYFLKLYNEKKLIFLDLSKITIKPKNQIRNKLFDRRSI